MSMKRTQQKCRFKPGETYCFEHRSARGIGSKAGNERRKIRFSYVEQIYGHGVSMFMFRSVAGKWRETFTPYQLADYTIEKVA
jgi:hypothetical protein